MHFGGEVRELMTAVRATLVAAAGLASEMSCECYLRRPFRFRVMGSFLMQDLTDEWPCPGRGVVSRLVGGIIYLSLSSIPN